MTTLSPEEIERYKRHLLVKDIGGQGQQRLKAARVLIVGAGGLGSPLLMYLAAAGVGALGIIDDDRVSLGNLQRQVAYRTDDIGALKTDRAAALVHALNPHVEVEAMPFRLTAENALAVVSRYDIVADGSDNFATRYLVNDACYFAMKPLVFAALGQMEGYVSTFRAYEMDESGTPRPSYRDLFPEPPAPGEIPTCEEAGVLGPVAGVIGTLQAVEVVKSILGLEGTLVGRLLIYDALVGRFQTIALKWDANNPLTGLAPSIRDLSIHAADSEQRA
ncbi:UBA/THIF-type NAD/FAD binding protein [Rhodomicrobium vannielii ATCC 17100]|uniref:Molybdopterin-synthase adenylyltransferase n=1 Tax=Rhodomicrobium vannielii (strain ATCC 17100 / DSM 162 / LMG 4299 / NCIMB 10020 / ATH 3.1.1) TaxID=648757 RepID=E3I5R6_RHOVT|nr:HesA/MoeB/ThiF family protein [Rhodomicrobium vannielii]ADP69419.1 UBA/THIF-type NAD/FAD binding protein [Rhodomicrobium vannielii ATCC 17100]